MSYCARMHQALFPATLKRYKDQVRFVYKDFPLSEIHPGPCMRQWTPTAWPPRAAMSIELLDYSIRMAKRSAARTAIRPKLRGLDRIARQEATVAKLDSTKLDACLAKQDESAVNGSLKEASLLASMEPRPCLSTANASMAPSLRKRSGWQLTALRAEGEKPPAEPAASPAAPPCPTELVKPEPLNRCSPCYRKTGLWIYP